MYDIVASNQFRHNARICELKSVVSKEKNDI